MNELLGPASPDTLVECPVCEGPAEVRHGARELRCDGCGVTVAIAPDEPAARVRMAAPVRTDRRPRRVALALTAG